MAKIFLSGYPDDTETNAVSVGESVHETEWERERRIREINELKDFTEALIKNNKLLKQEIKLRKAEKKAAKKAAKKADKKATKKHKRSGLKGFFRDLGKAFCKAVPIILTTLVTGVVGYFFEGNPDKKAHQPAFG